MRVLMLVMHTERVADLVKHGVAVVRHVPTEVHRAFRDRNRENVPPDVRPRPVPSLEADSNLRLARPGGLLEVETDAQVLPLLKRFADHLFLRGRPPPTGLLEQVIVQHGPVHPLGADGKVAAARFADTVLGNTRGGITGRAQYERLPPRSATPFFARLCFLPRFAPINLSNPPNRHGFIRRALFARNLARSHPECEPRTPVLTQTGEHLNQTCDD